MEKGTQVRRKDNPGKIGTATGNQRPRNGIPYYSIRWHDGTTDYCSSELLEVLKPTPTSRSSQVNMAEPRTGGAT